MENKRNIFYEQIPKLTLPTDLFSRHRLVLDHLKQCFRKQHRLHFRQDRLWLQLCLMTRKEGKNPMRILRQDSAQFRFQKNLNGIVVYITLPSTDLMPPSRTHDRAEGSRSKTTTGSKRRKPRNNPLSESTSTPGVQKVKGLLRQTRRLLAKVFSSGEHSSNELKLPLRITWRRT